MLKRAKKAKILTSNFSIKEQQEFTEKTLQCFPHTKRNVMFMGESFIETKSNEFSILKKTDGISPCEKISSPKAMLNVGFLNEIFKRLKENSLNRNFNIRVETNGVVTVADYLFSDIFTVEDMVEFTREDFSFTLDSKIFYYLKLNQKTISRKSILYVGEDYLIYENNRGRTINTYLFPRKEENYV